jgi:hypothetical protein
MRTLLVGALALLVPTLALAQPGPDGGGAPAAPPPDGSYPPAPPPPPPAAAPVVMQPPAPVVQPAPVAVAPVGYELHKGVTFEANLGIGFARVSSGGQSDDSDGALAGANLGIGGWINPRTAVTFRIAGVQVKEEGFSDDGTLIHAFAGPSVQYWPDPHFWLGGGAGFSVFRLVGTDCEGDQCGVNGFGLDFRAGYSFGNTQNQFNVSVEVNPGFYSQNGENATVTGVAFLLGYQYL